MVGMLERIGDHRWRLVLPAPHFESMLDVIELVPALIEVLLMPRKPFAALAHGPRHDQPRRRAPPRICARRSSADMPDLMNLYRDLHAHPELSMQETRSAATARAPRRARPASRSPTSVGGTGVVAVLANGAGPGAAAARRHGRAAGRGADRPALRQPCPRHQPHRRRERRDARLRPRHPYDDLGRHRAAHGGDAQRNGRARW